MPCFTVALRRHCRADWDTRCVTQSATPSIHSRDGCRPERSMGTEGAARPVSKGRNARQDHAFTSVIGGCHTDARSGVDVETIRERSTRECATSFARSPPSLADRNAAHPVRARVLDG